MSFSLRVIKLGTIVSGLILAVACSDNQQPISGYSTYGPDGVNMLITTPAGFLVSGNTIWPAPGNWGFIPAAIGEDGQPLSCLLVGHAVMAQEPVGIIPVAAVQWHVEGKIRTVLVGWSSKSGFGQDYLLFRMNHDAMRLALELWLKNVIAPESAVWIGWQNEVFAMQEIQRSSWRFSQIQTPIPRGD